VTVRRPEPVPVAMSWAELREGIAATWYSRVPAWDEAGQRRIDRATDRLLANAGYARKPMPEIEPDPESDS
jgi:hypothetical protein